MVRHMYKAFPNCMNNYCITVLVVKWWSTGHAINRDPLPPQKLTNFYAFDHKNTKLSFQREIQSRDI